MDREKTAQKYFVLKSRECEERKTVEFLEIWKSIALMTDSQLEESYNKLLNEGQEAKKETLSETADKSVETADKPESKKSSQVIRLFSPSNMKNETSINENHCLGDLVISDDTIGQIVDSSGTVKIIMTKNIFLKAYRKWVLNENE